MKENKSNSSFLGDRGRAEEERRKEGPDVTADDMMGDAAPESEALK